MESGCESAFGRIRRNRGTRAGSRGLLMNERVRSEEWKSEGKRPKVDKREREYEADREVRNTRTEV